MKFHIRVYNLSRAHTHTHTDARADKEQRETHEASDSLAAKD